jgi:hypothetical protein
MKTRTQTGYGLYDISRKIARRVQQERDVLEHETAQLPFNIVAFPTPNPGVFLPIDQHDDREVV